MSIFRKKNKNNSLFSEGMKIPKTAQDTIPFYEVYENGIFLVGENKYTLLFTFENLDYKLLRDHEQEEVYGNYQKLLNALPTDIHYQEFIMNSNINTEQLRKAMIPDNRAIDNELYDNYYDDILESKISQSAEACAKKIMVIALSYVPQTKIDNVNVLFKYFRELQTYYNNLGVETHQLMPEEVFKIVHEYYHPFDTAEFMLPANYFSRGNRLKDYIAPSMFAFKAKEAEVGPSLTRIMYVHSYDRELNDSFISELLDNNFKITVSKHVTRVDKGIALEKVRKEINTLQGKMEERREQNHKRGGNFIPFRMTDKLAELEELQQRLAGSIIELFEVSVFISLSAENKEDLEELTKFIKTKATKHQVKINYLVRQQEKGMNSVLPFGVDHLNKAVCTYLLTDAAAVLLPFSYRTYFSENGVFYGINRATNAAIVLDRTDEMNANGYFLGTAGSGKSMMGKCEQLEVRNKYSNDELIVIDPDGEYTILAQEENFDGEVLKLSPNSPTHYNIFDIDLSFSEDGRDAISIKSEFIMTVVETMKGTALTSEEKSVLDRCIHLAYYDYQRSGGVDYEKLPTLTTLYNLLKKQNETEAKQLALIMEIYVTGSLKNFADKTNIDVKDKYLVIDISDMGDLLSNVGLQIVLEFVWQRVVENKKKGIRTWLWCDEFSVMFSEKSTESGKFFAKVYKRIRKYGGVATGLTQNIEEVLRSPDARTMIENAEFKVLLQQKPQNLRIISEFFELSPSQEAYLKTGEKGTGLVICGNKVIPFDNRMKKEGIVYDTISTNFKEYQAKLAQKGVV